MAEQVIVKDAAAVDQFAARLMHVKGQLEQASAALRSALNGVGPAWHDPQKEKCAREIEAISRAIHGFAQAAEVQANYCRRLAAHVRATPR
jgi:hypothetical protein